MGGAGRGGTSGSREEEELYDGSRCTLREQEQPVARVVYSPSGRSNETTAAASLVALDSRRWNSSIAQHVSATAAGLVLGDGARSPDAAAVASHGCSGRRPTQLERHVRDVQEGAGRPEPGRRQLAMAFTRARSPCAALFSFSLVWSCASLLLLLPPVAHASGFFELQVLGIDNPGGLLLDGGCCGSRCPGRCNTYFRLCLKEYQAQVDLSGACTFGNLTSPLIGGSSFSLQTHPDRQLLLRLPFHFRWTVSPSSSSPHEGGNGRSARSSLAAFLCLPLLFFFFFLREPRAILSGSRARVKLICMRRHALSPYTLLRAPLYLFMTVAPCM